MNIAPFSPIGNSITVAATSANTSQQMLAAALAGGADYNLRVVNEAGTPALIVMGAAGADATAGGKVMSVLPGTERVFQWRPDATHVGVALRSGSGNVQLQLGQGV